VSANIGEYASIGVSARIGESASIERGRYLCLIGVGSASGTLMAYPRGDHIEVTRGCFIGTLDEFEAAVRTKHADTPYLAPYLAVIAGVRAWAEAMKGANDAAV
jgi:hypothetical protein